MVKLFKLHKFFGLSAGLVLLILGLTGFFIDHDKWSFLYTTTFTTVPQETKNSDIKLFDAYLLDADDFEHIVVGGKRGIYESFDDGETYIQVLNLQCNGIRSDAMGTFAATSDGIYKLEKNQWNFFALKNEYITALSIYKNRIVAIVDKHQLVVLNRKNSLVISKNIVKIDTSKLQEDIKLSRFVRDLHYGRGLFDGDISLLINDYGAIIMSLLALSGYLIWFYIHKKKKAKVSRRLIKWHANTFAVLSLIPLLILAITGVFLDHSNGLSKFMKSVTIPHFILPPVYESLQHDIWSVDYDGTTYRIGNRYGVYKSKNLKIWDLESRGLAFRMIRKEDTLYVSGMGAPNRIYNKKWNYLRGAPHMFRDVYKLDGEVRYFSTNKFDGELPKFEDATLYSVLLSMHDGTFFAPWWVWINDFASIGLLILGITGIIRWIRKKKVKLNLKRT